MRASFVGEEPERASEHRVVLLGELPRVESVSSSSSSTAHKSASAEAEQLENESNTAREGDAEFEAPELKKSANVYQGWAGFLGSSFVVRTADAAAAHALAGEAVMLLRVLLRAGAEWREFLMERFERSLVSSRSIIECVGSADAGELPAAHSELLGALNVLGGFIECPRIGARARYGNETYLISAMIPEEKRVELVQFREAGLVAPAVSAAQSLLHLKPEVRSHTHAHIRSSSLSGD